MDDIFLKAVMFRHVLDHADRAIRTVAAAHLQTSENSRFIFDNFLLSIERRGLEEGDDAELT